MPALLSLLRRIRGRLGKMLLRVVGPKFANRPENLKMAWPYEIQHPERIWVGDNCNLGEQCKLVAMVVVPTWCGDQHFDSRIVIGNNVHCEGRLSVYALGEVIIEDGVMFAGNVFIIDANHAYDVPNVPISRQGFSEPMPVRIGAGSWISQNAVILPGVTIGHHAVIGANAVVGEDVPDGATYVGPKASMVDIRDLRPGP